MSNKRILIQLAHPAIQNSRVNISMLNVVKDCDNVTINPLYEKYPDFNIDVKHEQELLLRADIIILQHPFYWYSSPALLKEWQDKVLLKDFAYGRKGNKLKGKVIFSAISAGGTHDAYQHIGRNIYTIKDLLRPFELTARLCGMSYEDPFVIYDADRISSDRLTIAVSKYCELVASL